jgi:16S rRNA processing protein RimM
VKTNLTSVGIIGKPHGISGAFHFSFHFPLITESIPPVFFVETKDGILPFFRKNFHLSDEYSGIMSFEEIDKREKLTPLVSRALMMKECDVSDYFDNTQGADFTGFEVTDKKLGKLGVVTNVIDNTVQKVLCLDVKGQEIMFPMVDLFVEKIDYKNQRLFTTLPEGILEVYTQTSYEKDED